MKDVALVTYTTSKYSDVWPMHFGQLSQHANQIKSYVFSDHKSLEIWNYDNHKLVSYNNDDHYWKQYLECLESVVENFVIYLQEDFILFADVDYAAIDRYKSFLENSNYDYVRLLRCGFSTPLNKKVVDDIYEVDMLSNDAFSMQATLWKKDSLKKLYSYVKSEKWLESDLWNIGTRDCNIRGTFVYNDEPKVGAYHYDSKVYPYVCTAVNRGKWNVDQYPQVMSELFLKYSIDPTVRGIRPR